MGFVSIESPFNSRWPWLRIRNIQYAILANTHAASLGDSTWAPHLSNTQFCVWGINGYISDSLADAIIGLCPHSQQKYYLGREETLTITNKNRQEKCDKVVCYTDYGISSGMQTAIEAAKQKNIPVEYRTLPQDLKEHVIGESLGSTGMFVARNVAKVTVFGVGLVTIIRKFGFRR